MTAVTIIFAIVADFLLLPPLLMAIDGKEKTNV
jgi:predicted RND superfamily exporter protein